MTQNELAEKLGISEQAISKWENGVTHPDISILPLIAKLFRVSIDRLFEYRLDSYDSEIDAGLSTAESKCSTPIEWVRYLSDALTRYPNSAKIKYSLATSYRNLYVFSESDAEREQSIQEGIKLLCEITDYNFDRETLDSAYYMLASMYTIVKEYENAERCIKNISSDDPYFRISAMVNLLQQKNDTDAMQKFAERTLFRCAVTMYSIILCRVNVMHSHSDYEGELAQYRLGRKILELFDAGGDDFYINFKSYERYANCVSIKIAWKKRRVQFST